jgi:phospholysine phosphohistidine inorganic pyrophosphate phosphatase
MIGDDIQNDIGGAQACGIRGVQVRTGKFRYQKT